MSIALPGFADPVAGAQACFRAVLDAMSRPGTVRAAGVGLAPPAPLAPATAAVLLTLVDADTPLFLPLALSPAADWVVFHCGTAMAAEDAARFIVAERLPDLGALSAGTDDGPEDSATVILQVPGLDGPPIFRLSGPGIETVATLPGCGLPADFPARWARNRALFPRGVDLILCAGERLAALPRGVSVEAI